MSSSCRTIEVAWRGCTRPSRDHLQHQAMGLAYSFDPSCWHLGTLCKRGHRWPGTDQSIRRNDPRAPKCAGCETPAKGNYWLLKFVNFEASGVPGGHKLGKLCAKAHDWRDTGFSLRAHRKCVECEKLRIKRRTLEQQRAYYQENKERLRRYAREYQAAKRQDLEVRAKRAAWVKEKRQREGRQSRSRHGMPYMARTDAETRAMRAAIKGAGRLPSVVRLVHDQQREHWRRHPEDYRAFALARSARRHHWLYMTDEAYRLYQRQKSSRRKVVMRESVGIRLTGKQVRWRFAQFEHRCAYCGAKGDLHIEHVVPISQGGTHALGNIIPACQRCNFNKAAKEVESWYRGQPFFSEQRWRKIRRVLGWANSSVGQLALL